MGVRILAHCRRTTRGVAPGQERMSVFREKKAAEEAKAAAEAQRQAERDQGLRLSRAPGCEQSLKFFALNNSYYS